MRKLISAFAVASLLSVTAVPAALACEGHDKKATAEKKAKAKPAKLATATFKIEGMHCGGCADKVKTALADKEGIWTVKVDPAGSAVVEYDPSKTDSAKIAQMITATGYKATAEA